MLAVVNVGPALAEDVEHVHVVVVQSVLPNQLVKTVLRLTSVADWYVIVVEGIHLHLGLQSLHRSYNGRCYQRIVRSIEGGFIARSHQC
jgi:hypothetical protein